MQFVCVSSLGDYSSAFPTYDCTDELLFIQRDKQEGGNKNIKRPALPQIGGEGKNIEEKRLEAFKQSAHVRSSEALAHCVIRTLPQSLAILHVDSRLGKKSPSTKLSVLDYRP